MQRQKGNSQTTNLSFIIFFLCSFICKLSAAEFFVQPVVFCQDNIAYIEISYVLKPSSSSFVIANAKKYFQLSVFLRNKMGISKAEKFQISCEDPKSGTIHLMRKTTFKSDPVTKLLYLKYNYCQKCQILTNVPCQIAKMVSTLNHCCSIHCIKININ